MEEVLWKLFKKTGNIKYFLLIKKLGSSDYNDKEDRRNNNKREKL